jgi:hypothetical protein
MKNMSVFFIGKHEKHEECDYRPLLLSNRFPEMYLNNPKSGTLRFPKKCLYDLHIRRDSSVRV